MGQDRETRWADLLRRANRGDRAAYTRFLSEIAPVLRGVVAARNGGRTEDNEDILQTTLIAIHEKRHTWRETDPVSAWLYAIARYKTADAWRRRRRDRTDPLDGRETLVEDSHAVDPSVAHDLEALLGRLDASSAALVREVRIEGASAEEAGARRGMSAGAVRVALHRAMARLSRLAQDEEAPTPKPATARKDPR